MSESTSNNTPILAAIVAAGSLGGLGGHTIGSSGDETLVNASTLESCIEFVRHGRQHEREFCEIEKLKLLLECDK